MLKKFPFFKVKRTKKNDSECMKNEKGHHDTRQRKPKHGDVLCSFSSSDLNAQRLDQRAKHFAQLNRQDIRLSCIYNLSFWSPDAAATQWSGPANRGQRCHTARLQPVTLAPVPPGFLRTRLVNVTTRPQFAAMGRLQACECSVYKVSFTQLHITLRGAAGRALRLPVFTIVLRTHFRLRGHIFRSMIQ